MGWFDLPEHWVYVIYEDGKTENVANTDSLSKKEAQWFKDHWAQARGKKVVEVSLETDDGVKLKTFNYKED